VGCRRFSFTARMSLESATVISSLADESPEQRRGRRRGVGWFLVLAFGLAWGSWAIAYAAGYSLDQPVVQLMTAAFAPALAAVITRAWITREGFADAGLRPRFRVARRQYVAAVVTPLLVLPIALVLCAVFGVWEPSMADLADPALLMLLVGAPIICLVAAPLFWGEEFGWTAYLRNRLMPGRPVMSTFAVGVVWGLWHWPLPFIGYFGPDRGVGELLGSMAMWLVLSVVLEFLISWLWFSSGSVWPSCLLHAGCNLIISEGMLEVHGEQVNVNVSAALMCLAFLPLVIWIIASGHVGDRSAPRITASTSRLGSGTIST
jgi:uncharacterized protein